MPVYIEPILYQAIFIKLKINVNLSLENILRTEMSLLTQIQDILALKQNCKNSGVNMEIGLVRMDKQIVRCLGTDRKCSVGLSAGMYREGGSGGTSPCPFPN